MRAIVKSLHCLIAVGAIFAFRQTVCAADDINNNAEPPVVYSDDIIISEIVPAPGDGAEEEFIELYNTGDEPVDLCKWQLDDKEEGSSPKIIENSWVETCTILPHAYEAFYYGSAKLNNTGEDMARLLDPDGLVKSFVSYSDAKADQSYSLIDGGWVWTLKLTPNTGNVLEEVVVPEVGSITGSMAITEARKLPNGQTATIEGVVTASPGVLSNNFFYVEDGTGGIQIYNYHKDFPSLKKGDRVRIIGELSETSGERRI